MTLTDTLVKDHNSGELGKMMESDAYTPETKKIITDAFIERSVLEL